MPFRQFRPGDEAQLADLARRNNLKTRRRKLFSLKALWQYDERAISTELALFSVFGPVACRVESALRLPVEILSSRDQTFSGAGSVHPVRGGLPSAGFYRPVLRGTA